MRLSRLTLLSLSIFRVVKCGGNAVFCSIYCRIDDARAQVEETLSLSERYPNERACALLTLARIKVAAGSPRGRSRRDRGKQAQQSEIWMTPPIVPPSATFPAQIQRARVADSSCPGWPRVPGD